MQKLEIRSSILNIASKCYGSVALSRENKIERNDLSSGRLCHRWIENQITLKETIDLPKKENDAMHSFWLWFSGLEEVKNILIDSTWFVEKEFKHTFGDWILTGHPDAVCLCAREGNALERVFIFDWKTGDGQKYVLPPIEEDWQMAAYAAFAHDEFGDCDYHVLRVRTHDHEIDRLDLTASDIENIGDQIDTLGKKIINNQKQFDLGYHCEHCLVKRFCPQQQKLATRGSYLLLPIEGAEIAITDQMINEYAIVRNAILRRVDTLEDALTKKLKAGEEIINPITSQKLIGKKYSIESITDSKYVYYQLRDYVGMPADECVTVNKTGVIKVLKEQGKTKVEIENFWNKMKTSNAVATSEAMRKKWV